MMTLVTTESTDFPARRKWKILYGRKFLPIIAAAEFPSGSKLAAGWQTSKYGMLHFREAAGKHDATETTFPGCHLGSIVQKEDASQLLQALRDLFDAVRWMAKAG